MRQSFYANNLYKKYSSMKALQTKPGTNARRVRIAGRILHKANHLALPLQCSAADVAQKVPRNIFDFNFMSASP